MENSQLKLREDMIQANLEIENIYKKLIDLRSKSKVIAFDIEILENQLKEFIGESTGIEGIATWKNQTRKSFDQEGFKQMHPDMFSKFSKEKTCRVFRLLLKPSLKDQ
jgi:DNA polymerase elongation subunit (family B)